VTVRERRLMAAMARLA